MASYAKLMAKAGHPIVKPKPATQPDPLLSEVITNLMLQVSALSDGVKRERGAIPLYYNLNRVWHALNAAQNCIPHSPKKGGKPGCEFCGGTGKVIYTAGGETRSDDCSCPNVK